MSLIKTILNASIKELERFDISSFVTVISIDAIIRLLIQHWGINVYIIIVLDTFIRCARSSFLGRFVNGNGTTTPTLTVSKEDFDKARIMFPNLTFKDFNHVVNSIHLAEKVILLLPYFIPNFWILYIIKCMGVMMLVSFTLHSLTLTSNFS